METNKENECKPQHSVAYIHSETLIQELDKIGQIAGRGDLVNSLINAYDLFNSDIIKIVKPFRADEKLLRLFHSVDYVLALQRMSCENEDEMDMVEAEEYGIGYDCPFIDNLYEHCCHIGGGSLTAAHLINSGSFKFVCNWFGGWHHAKRMKAGGFCYVNDIALCITQLKQKHRRVLYVDLDQHHGDGVQDAFEYTDSVMTFDMHKYLPGFYPGTGALTEIGKGKGKFYTANVPLRSGVNDKMFVELFSTIFNKIIERYRPEVIVTQCGADSLFGDPIDSQSGFNVSTSGYCECVKLIADTNVPTIFLGGGGYNHANTARLWCSITSLLSSYKLSQDIPEHANFLAYGPSYELGVNAGLNTPNKNSQDYANSILSQVLLNLDQVNVE